MTRTPINTNANSRTAGSERTSSLLRQIKNSVRKAALGSIFSHINDNSHMLHTGRGCFKTGHADQNCGGLEGLIYLDVNKPDKNGPAALVSIMGPPCGKLVI